MWNGYFRCKVNAGLSAGNKTTLEGQGLCLTCNEGACTDKPDLCCSCLTSVRYSIDDKEAISELNLASEPANAGIGEDDYAVLTQAQARQYLIDNKVNWEIP